MLEMNRILSLDPQTQMVRAEAGIVGMEFERLLNAEGRGSFTFFTLENHPRLHPGPRARLDRVQHVGRLGVNPRLGHEEEQVRQYRGSSRSHYRSDREGGSGAELHGSKAVGRAGYSTDHHGK